VSGDVGGEDLMNCAPIEVLEADLLAEFRRDPRAPRAARLLADYAERHVDWRRHVLYDASTYTRNLVARCAEFELLVLCWNVGQQSPIHNHAGQHCWMAVLDGEIEEAHYAFPDAGCAAGPLAPGRSLRFAAGKVAYIDDEIALHRVRPVPGTSGVTLHLYSKPIDVCQVYDETTGGVVLRRLAYHSLEPGQALVRGT
jgi:cysteine dioxygenase